MKPDLHVLPPSRSRRGRRAEAPETAPPRPGRRRIVVEGIVQGVGFRPHVHRLAHDLGLVGFVRNDPAGAVIEIEGAPDALDAFTRLVVDQAPPIAVVNRVSTIPIAPLDDSRFEIVESTIGGAGHSLVSADIATCQECVDELTDSAGRRLGYAFTTCTNCGPRYTIATGTPYDRVRTTMAGFALCAACRSEYIDPADRRFHAQPIACPVCGPTLSLSIEAAAGQLANGRIVAVKGLGGYQLACDAADVEAVCRLRAGKHRPDKPFAVMVADLAMAGRLCRLTDAEKALLASREAPIVICHRRAGAPVADEVAPGGRWLGVMLPNSPLHHLLLAAAARPLVMTSGNRSGEPIAVDDDEARCTLGAVADVFLAHNRPIAARADDSLARVAARGPLLLRRARGYAPEPVTLPVAADPPVLAVGAQLKHTFCLAAGQRAFLSPHIGDLSTIETSRAFAQTLEHYRRLFGIDPEVVVHDLHPDYLSTAWAVEQRELDAVGVQHHHAHIAACLAENGRAGPTIGLALDGTGFGTDGTLWGGEVLVCDLARYRRAGHLTSVPMPGGEAAVREPWRMAAAYLLAVSGPEPPAGLDLAVRNRPDWEAVASVARVGTLSPLTSGAGRLFDAVAAMLTGCDRATYEGQAATALEQLADPAETRSLPCPVRLGSDGLEVDTVELFGAVVDAHLAGIPGPSLAARFHNGLVGGLIAAADAVRDETGLTTVALSGGCLQNALLVDRLTSGLAAAGFEVLTHHLVPPNDGGISLGQAAVAAAQRMEVM